MIVASWVALVGAAPAFVVEHEAGPAAALVREARAAWDRIEAISVRAGVPRPKNASAPIRVRRAAAPPAGRAATSRPGVIELRVDTVLERQVFALHHEIAHQFLIESCPEAAEDHLFHEAFAMAVNGETSRWTEEKYLSLPAARKRLEESPTFDTPDARAAIARLLGESGEPGGEGGELPPPVARRLARCGGGARWTALMTPAELAGANTPQVADALIILSRHSGEVLSAQGAINVAMPFGSTLKPFVIAGAAGAPPDLAPDRNRAEWECGPKLPAKIGAQTALVRSCNGYFLDWGAGDPAIASLGACGPVLFELGLTKPSGANQIADVIGLRTSMAISPWALAQAYRLLADSRPDLIETLAETASRGTLADASGAKKVEGWAIKTGTVRDAESRPLAGWIAAVSGDLVAVFVRAGKPPKVFFPEARAVLAKAALHRAWRPARVQVFALVPHLPLKAKCDGTGVVLVSFGGTPELLPGGEFPLAAAAHRGTVLCFGGPFRVRSPDLDTEAGGREYAGVFRFDAAPELSPAPDATERARKARRGSDLVFATTSARYTAGVLAAEDAQIRGEARIALGRVVAHNSGAADSRHAGRPVCDTTHCQTFLGTFGPKPGDEAIFSAPPMRRGWLPFSKGGTANWTAQRSAAAVEAILGADATVIGISRGTVRYLVRAGGGGAIYDEQLTIPCERLRSPLQLPSCPESAERRGGAYHFSGKGEGHGEGLDVERAKKMEASAQEILRSAYGQF